MKNTQTKVTEGGIKVTRTHTVDADDVERITSTASVKHGGVTCLFQKVRVSHDGGNTFKTLYTRSTNGKQKSRIRDIFVWIKLGRLVELNSQKPE